MTRTLRKGTSTFSVTGPSCCEPGLPSQSCCTPMTAALVSSNWAVQLSLVREPQLLICAETCE